VLGWWLNDCKHPDAEWKKNQYWNILIIHYIFIAYLWHP
jgi:hypothetical protein